MTDRNQVIIGPSGTSWYHPGLLENASDCLDPPRSGKIPIEQFEPWHGEDTSDEWSLRISILHSSSQKAFDSWSLKNHKYSVQPRFPLLCWSSNLNLVPQNRTYLAKILVNVRRICLVLYYRAVILVIRWRISIWYSP